MLPLWSWVWAVSPLCSREQPSLLSFCFFSSTDHVPWWAGNPGVHCAARSPWSQRTEHGDPRKALYLSIKLSSAFTKEPPSAEVRHRPGSPKAALVSHRGGNSERRSEKRGSVQLFLGFLTESKCTSPYLNAGTRSVREFRIILWSRG